MATRRTLKVEKPGFAPEADSCPWSKAADGGSREKWWGE